MTVKREAGAGLGGTRNGLRENRWEEREKDPDLQLHDQVPHIDFLLV